MSSIKPDPALLKKYPNAITTQQLEEKSRFLGTLLGQSWSSQAISVVFFAVAAGSILYVVQELFAVNRKYGHNVLVTWLVLAGIVLGFATDFVVAAAGL